jgi:hypothetical protein
MSLNEQLLHALLVIDRVWPRYKRRRQAAKNRFWLFWQILCAFLGVSAVWTTISGPLLAGSANEARDTLMIANRSIVQDQGTWVVDYRLRYTGKAGIIICPGEFSVRVEGWVSNSRVLGHGLPRWSSLLVAHTSDPLAICDLVAATDEAQRCRDRLIVSSWTEHDMGCAAHRAILGGTPVEHYEAMPDKVGEPALMLPLSLGPGEILRVRLRFEHEHILYGEYDPLLSMRTFVLTVGSASVSDIIPLNREQYLAQPKFSWPEPPEDRRDTRHAVSGPDSLHLKAHVPGHQYYRYVDRPVRYNTQMRLRFWYLVAAGTEGDCKVRVAQCKETPVAWRMLNNGLFEQCLKTVGRWTKVERMIQIEPEATKLTLEFKIVSDTEVGEMWIDDVSLEPLGYDRVSGP